MLKRLRQRIEDNRSQPDSDELEDQQTIVSESSNSIGERSLNEFAPEDQDDDLQAEEDEEFDEPASWFDRDSLAFIASVGAHILVVVGLASITIGLTA